MRKVRARCDGWTVTSRMSEASIEDSSHTNVDECEIEPAPIESDHP